MARLEGRTAIVTGGAKGIGVHYSKALAAEGAQVMIADIADGSALAAEIAAKHGRNSTDSMVFDVSDEAQCKALVGKTLERFGKIDILINNAALYAPLPTLKVTDIDVELWDKVMGDQHPRAVPDGQARRAAHEGAQSTARSSTSARARWPAVSRISRTTSPRRAR